MNCRPGCGACCIAISISSPIPQMPKGKPAGERCIQLDEKGLCLLFGQPSRPAVCSAFKASEDFCGKDRKEALMLISEIERATDPLVQRG